MTLPTRLIAEANKNGISLSVLRTRLNRGWAEERAVSEPVEKPREKWLKVAEENGVSKGLFDNRVYMYNWSYKKAATTPPKQYNREYQKWLKIAQENGIKESTFNGRIYNYGYTYEDAATKPVKRRRVFKW